MGLLTALSVAKRAAKAAGRLSGVIGTHDTGVPIKARGSRLVVTGTALLAAVLTHFGLSAELAQALADFAVAVGDEYTQ